MKLRRDPFQAIADPTRRAILVLLTSQAMTAGAIANNFEVAQPTISRHLKVLSECELVEAKQVGREVIYDLRVDKMKEIDQWLDQFRKIWQNRFDKLDQLIHNLKNKK